LLSRVVIADTPPRRPTLDVLLRVLLKKLLRETLALTLLFREELRVLKLCRRGVTRDKLVLRETDEGRVRESLRGRTVRKLDELLRFTDDGVLRRLIAFGVLRREIELVVLRRG
jgi:hypothetical protein